jgi:hypothetical protein
MLTVLVGMSLPIMSPPCDVAVLAPLALIDEDLALLGIHLLDADAD